MFLDHVGVYKDIIQIDVQKAANDITEYRGHQSLKGGRGVTISLLYHITNVGASNGGEGCFRDILGSHLDLFISVC